MLKKINNNIPLTIIIILSFIIILLFTIYELILIKNPFMDPIPPYWLWLGMSCTFISFLVRYFQRKP